MRISTRRAGRALAVAAALGFVLAACGSNDISSSGDSTAVASDCGAMKVAVNPWVGMQSSSYVVGELAKSELGCDVTYLDPIKEEVAWQGFGTGEVDVIIENWGHDDLKAKYIDDQGTAVDLGPNGNQGIIGWYVPPWLAEAHPDVTDWKNLNKYASDFATAETGDKGQLLDGDPSYVTYDEALVENLGLNYQVVVGGSEAALIQQFRQAQKNKEWLLAYFYSPQWFWNEMEPVRVNLPPYEKGCDADPATIACDYPDYTLDKIASADWVATDDSGVNLVKNFSWTNEDQNTVSTYISEDAMSPEEAAQKWIDDNPDVWGPWLDGTSATPSTS